MSGDAAMKKGVNKKTIRTGEQKFLSKFRSHWKLRVPHWRQEATPHWRPTNIRPPRK